MNASVAGFFLLGRILSPFTPSKQIRYLRYSMGQVSLPWESIIATANNHMVTPALWVGLVQKKLDTIITPEVRSYLQTIYALNLDRNRALKRQALEAIRLLNGRGIQPLLIKGCTQLFNPFDIQMGSRVMTDIDMRVSAAQMAVAVDALTSIGYSSGGKILKNYHHWAPLFRSGEYGAIELHYEVLPEPICKVLNASDICNQAIAHELSGAQFYTPSPAHSILLGMLHSQVKDRFHDEWIIGLKSLNDLVVNIAQYRATMPWLEIEDPLVRHGYLPVYTAYLWSAHRLFGLPLPFGFPRSLRAVLHHLICLAAVRWSALDRLTLTLDRLKRFFHRRMQCAKSPNNHSTGEVSHGLSIQCR